MMINRMATITRRCISPYCVTVDGHKGRMFQADTDDTSIESAWCHDCIELYKHTRFFTMKTVEMIRGKYTEYNNTELPKEVKLILTQFTREIIKELGEEL